VIVSDPHALCLPVGCQHDCGQISLTGDTDGFRQEATAASNLRAIKQRASFSRQAPAIIYRMNAQLPRSRNARHGFVRLSPCFSRALAPGSAESRHDAEQFFTSRIKPMRK